MTEYEQLIAIQPLQQKKGQLALKIDALENKKRKLNQIQEQKGEILLSSEKKYQFTFKVWYIISFILSLLIFQFVAIPYLFPIIIDVIEGFESYSQQPIETGLTVYRILFMIAFLVPLIFYRPSRIEDISIMPVAQIIMGVFVFALTFVLYAVIYIGDNISYAGLDDLILWANEFLDPIGYTSAFHLGINGIFFLLINFAVLNIRSRGIKRYFLHAFKALEQKNTAELDICEKELNVLWTEKSDLDKRIKSYDIYDALNKSNISISTVISYFTDERIISIKEAQLIYKVEQQADQDFLKEKKIIESQVNEAVDHNRQITKFYEEKIKDVIDYYDSVSFDQAIALDKQEKNLDKLKNINR